MNASELKYNVEKTGSNFFSRKSMQFFGDTMRNYGVRSNTVTTYEDETVEVWELYRKHAVKYTNQSSAVFRKDTFKRVHFPREKNPHIQS